MYLEHTWSLYEQGIPKVPPFGIQRGENSSQESSHLRGPCTSKQNFLHLQMTWGYAKPSLNTSDIINRQQGGAGLKIGGSEVMVRDKEEMIVQIWIICPNLELAELNK